MTRLPVASSAMVLALAVSGIAHADRALTPVDTLETGFVEIGAKVGELNRRFDLLTTTNEQRFRARSREASLSVRLWMAAGFSLGVSGDAFFARTANTNGLPLSAYDEGGVGGLTLDTRLVRSVASRLQLGGAISLYIPGNEYESSRLGLGFIAGYRVGERVKVFGTGRYDATSGDTFSEVGDVVSIRIGTHHRFGKFSLIPELAFEHTIKQGSMSSSFQAYRAAITTGYEVGHDVALTASLGVARATEHAVTEITRGSGYDITAGLGIKWALDASSLQRPPTPEPAALQLSVISNQAAGPALRKQLPALRRATLAAERDAGGAHGTIAVFLRLAEDGRVARVDLGDSMNKPKLALAVRRFYEGARFPTTGSVQFTVSFRNFERTETR